jgi:hypothetical protein
MISAHVAGLPVEESALSFGPVLMLAATGAAAYGRHMMARLRRPRKRARR